MTPTENLTDRRPARVAIVVVRFKKQLHEISLLRALPMIDLSAVLEIIIVDNSPEPASVDETAALPGVVKYRWLGGNVGLARAYNSAVSQLQSDWTHTWRSSIRTQKAFSVSSINSQRDSAPRSRSLLSEQGRRSSRRADE